jgi:molybdopterin-guanine dinucleotide biosynthesis protein A
MVTADDGYAAVVLAGGTAARLDGADKAGLEHDGRTLLEHALAAVAGAVETVVVGDPVPTSRPVTFVREDPPYGGPAAGLLAGRSALRTTPAWLVVLAVDMPLVSPATVSRLLAAAAGRDGAFLTDEGGRRQLAGVLLLAALDRVRPGDAHGLPLHRLLAPLDLATVSPVGPEGTDVDTWADVCRLRGEPGNTS